MANLDTRYIVSWVPASEVEKLCQKRGMRPGDDTSFWDWCEPNECERQLEKHTFDAAIFAAKAVLKFDVCGEVRIGREFLTRNHDDLGNPRKGKSWEEDAVWHVYGPDDELTETDPDYFARAA